MTLEKKKKHLELLKVKLAREELELKIAEKEEDISRIRSAIDIQVTREKELEKELSSMK